MQQISALKERNSSITIVRNDLQRLYSALYYRDHIFNIDQLHLIIIVGRIGENRYYKQESRISESFDTTIYQYSIRVSYFPVFNIDSKSTDIQTSLLLYTKNSWVSFDNSQAEVLYQCHTLPIDPLDTPYSYSFDILETDFHELDSDTELATFNPKYIQYILKPQSLEVYTVRVFIIP